MINFKSIKTQLNLFLGAFALYLFLKEPRSVFLAGFAWALLFSILIEGVILFIKTRKFQVTESALTSGLIIGFLLASGSPWWLFLAAAVFTFGLKYILRFRGKNIFNPAALGIFLTVLLLGGRTEWKGAYLWYLLVPAGVYFVYKIRKIELVLGYFAAALLLFIPQALSQGASLWNIPGYFNYFFIFIMLIEPKTTPSTRWAKVIFGAGTALLFFGLTEWGFRYEPELFSLLVLNAFVPLLNKIPALKLKTTPKTS